VDLTAQRPGCRQHPAVPARRGAQHAVAEAQMPYPDRERSRNQRSRAVARWLTSWKRRWARFSH